MKRLLVGLLLLTIVAIGAPSAAAQDDSELNITSAADGSHDVGDVSSPQSVPELYGSPYDSVTLEVAVESEDGLRDVNATIEDAMAYWEANALRYAGYPVEYERVNGDADVALTLVTNVSTCGVESGRFLGCATLVQQQAPTVVNASVEVTQTNQGVYETAVHEFGHTLGLEHGDEPERLMQAVSNKWGREELGVLVRGDTDAVDQQDLLAGLTYISEQTSATNASYIQVHAREQAEIVVNIGGECTEEFVSCGDTTSEFSDQSIINVTGDLDREAVPWHVAYITAQFAGEVPRILQPENAGHDDRRSEWWDTS